MNMRKKYFKCYFCQTGNSYLVPKDEKGKNCRCCLAYNYFFKKNHKKKKNNNNFNYYSNYNNNNNYKNKKYHNYKNYKPKKNNNFQNNNNTNINNNNQNPPSYINIQRNLPNYTITYFNQYMTYHNDINFHQNNQSFLPMPIIPNNIIKEDKKEKKSKYSWLVKEKLTEELIKQKKDGYECSICLEDIKINEDISKLKCGHIFHYNCIEELVNHRDDKCPNCRCDLKTGEKQKDKDKNNSHIFSLNYNYDIHNFGNIITDSMLEDMPDDEYVNNYDFSQDEFDEEVFEEDF